MSVLNMNAVSHLCVLTCLLASLITAVLVWLNYKNAYEYWTDLRLAQVKDVPGVGGNILQIPEESVGVPVPPPDVTSSAPLSTLFLQLTVDDLGICLPIGSMNQVRPRPPPFTGVCMTGIGSKDRLKTVLWRHNTD